MEFDVIIPVFDRIAPLRRAVQSVLDQKLSPKEVIVVNDGSSLDMTGVRNWVEQSGCRWLEMKRNAGPAEARNMGVAAGQSRWITFLDSDDIWMPSKLSRQQEWIEANSDLRILQVREQWIRDGRAVEKPSHWEPGEGDLFSESCQRCSIGPSCVAIRRDLWDAVGGFDERYRVCEDYQLWLRITHFEPVGLVPGTALVEKCGGHEDQLSMNVPAMDRYRVMALLEMLAGEGMTMEQRAVAIQAVKEKSKILAQGAAKRGMEHRAQLYAGIGDLDLEGARSSLDAVSATLWGEVLSG